MQPVVLKKITKKKGNKKTKQEKIKIGSNFHKLSYSTTLSFNTKVWL